MSQNKIYVGNLSYGTSSDELEAAFNTFGAITEVRLITDRETGRSKGFAFITFESSNDAQSALSLDGTDLGGRRIKVNIAQDQKSGGNRGRGGRDGGSGARRNRW